MNENEKVEDACEGCRFYRAGESNPNKGLCMFNPPVVVAYERKINRTQRPVVKATDYCSRWADENMWRHMRIIGPQHSMFP